ncbi:MAG: LuxR C-terminal-related transcriptional regulator [Reichenbachiella sp.]
MKKIIHFACLYFVILQVNGQTLDALKQQIDLHPDSAQLYLKVFQQYQKTNRDSGFYYLDIGYQLVNHDTLRAAYFNAYGVGYYYEARASVLPYDTCITLFSQAAHLYQMIGDQKNQAAINLKLSIVTVDIGQYKEGMNYIQQAQDVYEVLQDSFALTRVHNIRGNIFYLINNYQAAYDAYQLSATIGDKGVNDYSKFKALGGMASVLQDQRAQYDSAIILYDSVYNYFITKNSPFNAGKVLNNIGNCYFEKGDYPNAKTAILEAIDLKRPLDAEENTASSYELMARVLLASNNYPQALVFIDSAESIFLKFDHDLNIAGVWKYKAKILTALEKYEASNQIYVKYVTLKDSINEVQFAKDINELDTKYESEKKEKELAQLALIKQENDNEIQLSRVKITVLILLIILLVIGFAMITNQRKQKHELRHQLLNEEIDGLRLRIGKIVSDVKLDELALDKDKINSESPNSLTEREVQILQLAITNKTNAEIAEEIFLSVNTVKYHLKNIYAKLGVSTRLQARQALSQTI